MDFSPFSIYYALSVSTQYNLIAFHEPFASCKGNSFKFVRKSTKTIKIKMVQRNHSFKLCRGQNLRCRFNYTLFWLLVFSLAKSLF